jgi:hypothetical protein
MTTKNNRNYENGRLQHRTTNSNDEKVTATADPLTGMTTRKAMATTGKASATKERRRQQQKRRWQQQKGAGNNRREKRRRQQEKQVQWQRQERKATATGK